MSARILIVDDEEIIIRSCRRILEGDDYMVDHSVAILLVNPQGEISALFQPPHELEKLRADYLQVVAAAR